MLAGESMGGECIQGLRARLGVGAFRLLKPLAVDLEELAMLLEGDPIHGSGRIDLDTGEIWPQPAIEYTEETGELDETEDDSDRWLWVESEVRARASGIWSGQSLRSTIRR